MHHRHSLSASLVAGFLIALAPPAISAMTFHPVAVPVINTDIGTWSDGAVYEKVFPGTHVWNGVPFELVEDASGNKVFWDANPAGLDIQVGVFGAVDAYTIINTSNGAAGATVGSVEFFGSDSGYQKVDLVQGVNVRDHYHGQFNNVIDGRNAMVAWDPDARGSLLDMQVYHLSPDFADETLVAMRFNSHGSPGIAGLPFLAAATVAAIPEPRSQLLFVAGIGLVAWRLRAVACRRRL